MKTMKRLFTILLMFTAMAVAQTNEAKPINDYKVDFSVYEVQAGKRSNVRNYTVFVRGDGRMKTTRVGNRIPIATGKENNIQYMDVGLNFMCAINGEKDGQPLLDFTFELGSLVAPEGGTPDRVPVVRQVRQDGMAQITPGKATIIASMDDTNTSRTIQVE